MGEAWPWGQATQLILLGKYPSQQRSGEAVTYSLGGRMEGGHICAADFPEMEF